MQTVSNPLEIPDFFKERIKALSVGRIKIELELLLGRTKDPEFEFYRLDAECDKYVNTLNVLDRLLLARFMLNELIEKFQT